MNFIKTLSRNEMRNIMAGVGSEYCFVEITCEDGVTTRGCETTDPEAECWNCGSDCIRCGNHISCCEGGDIFGCAT